MMSRLEIVLDDLEIGYGIWLTIYFKGPGAFFNVYFDG